MGDIAIRFQMFASLGLLRSVTCPKLNTAPFTEHNGKSCGFEWCLFDHPSHQTTKNSNAGEREELVKRRKVDNDHPKADKSESSDVLESMIALEKEDELENELEDAIVDPELLLPPAPPFLSSTAISHTLRVSMVHQFHTQYLRIYSNLKTGPQKARDDALRQELEILHKTKSKKGKFLSFTV